MIRRLGKHAWWIALFVVAVFGAQLVLKAWG